MDSVDQKYERLKARLQGYSGAVVAFSGGVDSSLLLAVAREVLGERAVAATVVSDLLLPEERERSRVVAGELGAEHREIQVDLLSQAAVAENPPDRCFHCKHTILTHLLRLARDEGLEVVLEGSHLSDAGEYRPGLAAVRTLDVESPLQDACLGKEEIRTLSRRLGLSGWDRPALPCLATRFPYGTPITRQGVRQIRQGEAELARLGFSPLRLRHHGSVARLEVNGEQFPLALEKQRQIVEIIKRHGFVYAVLDLAGYRSGSMDEVLSLRERGVGDG